MAAAFAATGAGSALAAEGAPVRVMYGVSRPPFVMDQAGTGISVELGREAFHRAGIAVQETYGSNDRMVLALFDRSIDAAIEVQPGQAGIQYSQPFIAYRNHVAIRKGRMAAFRSWSDLAGLRVCAWQQAKRHIGDDFAKAIPAFAQYMEHARQQEQVRAWLSEDCEAILIDDTLLEWHRRALLPVMGDRARLAPGDIVKSPFPGSFELWWHAGFLAAALRDRFDAALASMRADGTYDRLRESLIDRLTPEAQ